MKKLALAIAIITVVGILTGCSHNACVYSDGIGVDVSLNPESYSIGLTIRYGKILAVAMKEKSELNLEAGMTQKTNSGENASSETGLDTKLTFKTGSQVTGYGVEKEKVKQEAKQKSAENKESEAEK